VFIKNIFYRSYKREDFEEATESHIDLDKLKNKMVLDGKFKECLKEIILTGLFAGLTFAIAYQLVDFKAYGYHLNLKNIFGAGKKSTIFLDVIILKSFIQN